MNGNSAVTLLMNPTILPVNRGRRVRRRQAVPFASSRVYLKLDCLGAAGTF